MALAIKESTGLDERLKNLELLAANASGGAIPACTRARNPFEVEQAGSEEAERKDKQLIREIFGNRCECGAERTTGVKSTPHNRHGAVNLEHSILNQPSFKHKLRTERRTIVRDSILRNIGKCVHHSLKKATDGKGGASLYAGSVGTAAVSGPGGPLKTSLSETNLTTCFAGEGDDLLDFKLLVSQCSELALSAVSSRDAPNFAHSNFRALRTGDLTWQQLSRSSFNNRRNRKRQLKKSNSTSSLDSDSSSSNSSPVNLQAPPVGGDYAQQAMLVGSVPSAAVTATSSNSSSPSSNSQTSASCSQQARLNVTPCDVTIDEMASYFETLVYIPKKMSTMAEMMYI